jgi:hypothetical protein
MHKHAAEMYAKLKAAMDVHVQKVGQTLVQELQGLSPENFLLVVDRAWQSHCRDVVRAWKWALVGVMQLKLSI